MNTDVFLNKEILIVEDEPLFAKRLSAYLRGQKASVTLSDSFADAKESLRKKEFDYALVDIVLPDGKGLDLLRENCFSPGTGVVIMTANSDIQTAIDAMRLGAGDYLSKPFEFDALIIAELGRVEFRFPLHGVCDRMLLPTSGGNCKHHDSALTA